MKFWKKIKNWFVSDMSVPGTVNHMAMNRKQRRAAASIDRKARRKHDSVSRSGTQKPTRE